MKLATAPQGVDIQLEPTEVLLFSNVLNEVCNGITISDFDGVVGPRDETEMLFHEFRRLPATSRARVRVSEEGLRILRSSLAVTLQELGEDEFSIRTGADLSLGYRLLGQLDDYANPARKT